MAPARIELEAERLTMVEGRNLGALLVALAHVAAAAAVLAIGGAALACEHGGACVETEGRGPWQRTVTQVAVTDIERPAVALDVWERGGERRRVWQLALERRDGTRALVLGEHPDPAVIEAQARAVNTFLSSPKAPKLRLPDPQDGSVRLAGFLLAFAAAWAWLATGVRWAVADGDERRLTVVAGPVGLRWRREIPFTKVKAIVADPFWGNRIRVRLNDGSVVLLHRDARAPWTRRGRAKLREAKANLALLFRHAEPPL